jgi:hypothetical protein
MGMFDYSQGQRKAATKKPKRKRILAADPITVNDKYHIGSDTKSMTATHIFSRSRLNSC